MDMSRGSKFKDGVRIAAAAYLIYLGMQVISEAVKDNSGNKQILFIIFGVAFIAIGVAIGIWSLKSLISTVKTESTDSAADPAEAESGKTEGVETEKAETQHIEAKVTEADDGGALTGTHNDAGTIAKQDEGLTGTENDKQQKEVDSEKEDRIESGEHKPSLFDKAGGNISGR